MAEKGQVVLDRERGALRTEIYGRLDKDRPRRWEELRGCTVTHVVFGEGTISKVMMPDWSNPVHVSIKFAQRERVFHLSALGDRTKFPEHDFPEDLATLIASVEAEIVAEQQRIEDARQLKESEAREVVTRRQDREAAQLEEKRHVEATEELERQAQAETRLNGICDRVAVDEPLTDEEIRLLLKSQRHDQLLAYYERLYARTSDHRTIVKAGTTWRTAGRPEYTLKVTALLLDGLDKLPESVRTAVLTLRGEAFLDLHQLAEAKECAQTAIAGTRKRPQPYQLLGAIAIADGDTTAGEQSFAEAREVAGVHGLGRVEKAQQAEIKKQMAAHGMDSTWQKAVASGLLRIDPARYAWVETYL